MNKTIVCLIQAVCIVGLAFILSALANPCAGQGIQKDGNGNYFSAKKEAATDQPATLETLTKNATKSAAWYTTSKGEKFPVWLSKSGAAFVVRTSKAGKVYRQYMPKD